MIMGGVYREFQGGNSEGAEEAENSERKERRRVDR
jgi:hypothetical protein